MADDIATTASSGCVLGSLRFRVSGDPRGDGTGDGPFSVTFALYEFCPSAGGEPSFLPQTIDFDDNGDYEVIFEPDADTIIAVPTNAYFGVRFSRSSAGIVVGAPSTLGFSADRYDFPGSRCSSYFGGFPGTGHASFDLELTARDDCPGGVCSSACVGGENAGNFCTRDDCPAGTCTPDIACVGGLDHIAACETESDCRNMCTGGSKIGNECDADLDCPNGCRGGPNDGIVCLADFDCPEGSCSIGACYIAMCNGDRCVGGSNDTGVCAIDECPAGSCNGAKACDGGTKAGQTCGLDCPPSFPAYKNSNQGGNMFSPQHVGGFFADDITLAISVDADNPCNLVSWEVGFRGWGIILGGAVQAELHNFIDDADPERGGRIPGTKLVDVITGASVQFLRRTFATPIPLTQQELFVVFRVQNPNAGPIRTCRQSELGSTEDVYFVHSGDEGDSWKKATFDFGCTGAFEVTLSCAGSAPVGACCDMILTDNQFCLGGPRDGLPCASDYQCRVCIGGTRDGFSCNYDANCPGGNCPLERYISCVGDSVCRELPEMNCATPRLWQEGKVCESACVGGENHAQICTRQADCPGGDCPGPFANACGVAACCTPDDTCENLTESDCTALSPPGDFVQWRGWGVCDAAVSQCPYYACLQRRGDCALARPDAGCEGASCCISVCEIDPWCCTVAWDELCVRESQDICGRRPHNWQCESALAVAAGDRVVVSNAFITNSPGEPTFPCHGSGSGCAGLASTWYTFEATHESARLTTCNTLPPAGDTLLQVFRAGDLTTPESACQTLETIACSDNVASCGGGLGSAVCVDGLTVGQMYYVMVSGKSRDTLGVVEFDIESPCPTPPPSCPVGAVEWLAPPSGIIDARQVFPFDKASDSLGISTIAVSAPAGADAACFSLSQTNANPNLRPPKADPLVTNHIASVRQLKGSVYILELARPLTPGEITSVSYTDEKFVSQTGHFGALPGDANADGTTDPTDVAFLVNVLSGTIVPKTFEFTYDIDRSGTIGPRDLLRLIDLLDHGWNGAQVPEFGACPETDDENG